MTVDDIDAIKAVDTALAALDKPARTRVLRWAWSKYGSGRITDEEPQEDDLSARKKLRKQTTIKTKTRHRAKAKSRPTIVRDLNLRPGGKKSLAEFISEKQPRDNQKKCVVAVFYLKHTLGKKAIDVNQVFTCYRNSGWRLPAALENTLSLTSHRKGWLDTSDMNDIKLTPHGENLVEHDLPQKSKGRKQ